MFKHNLNNVLFNAWMLLVQMTFFGENYYVSHTSKNNSHTE